MNRLKDKVAIICGGGSGLGEATSMLFAQEGAHVAICDINEENGNEVTNTITNKGGIARFFKIDVTDESFVQQVFEEIENEFGQIDILVNCAGLVGTTRLPDEIEYEEWEKILNLDLNGTFITSRNVIKYLRKQGGGSIVNISSIAGLVSECAGVTPYHVAKAGVAMMTKSFAVSYAKENIRCNCVCPAATLTKMTKAYAIQNYGSVKGYEDDSAGIIPMGRLGDPLETAYGILYLASDEASWTTGVALPIDGGLTSW